MKKEPTFIFGRHAVLEALARRPDIVRALWLRDDINVTPAESHLLRTVKRSEVFHGDKVPHGVRRDAVHQGFIAEVATDLLLVAFSEWRSALTPNPDTAVVVLGEVEDPHNVGAIIRSAAAFGAIAVLLPEHRSCPVTGTVIKVSAGTAFTLPLVSVGNVNDALRKLKDDGFWIYGLDGAGDTTLPAEQFTKPSVFVVGNEARGMRLKTHEVCDTILTIPMHDKAESLNASVSAATVLYAWSVQHAAALSC